MSILQVLTSEIGLVGVEPSYIYIKTNNTLAEVEVPGFLNQLNDMGYFVSNFNAALVYTTDYGAIVLQVVKNGSNYSLVQTISGSGVLSVSGTAGEIASTLGINPVLSLVDTAVTPGVYTNASLTVDAKGRLTAASSGVAPVTLVNGTANQIAISGSPTSPTVGFTTNVVFPGTVTLNADPVAPLQAATKQYVDMFAAGLTFKSAAIAATTVALTAAYNNGASGVGATLTNTGALAAFQLDGIPLFPGDRVLIKNQAADLQNGIYSVTVVGNGATPWVITRTTDYDTTPEVSEGDFLIVVEGTVNANTGWIQTAPILALGTSSITFVQFGIVGTGVTSVNGQANRITVTNPTTTALVDIAATYVGQTSITTLGTVTTGTWNGTTLDVAHGGTGITTATAYAVICGGTTATGPFQSLATLGTAGQVLTSAGAAALPTWQTPTTGTVTSVSGTLNRITSTGGATPVIDIDAAYVGQTSLTTLGTVTTGTWNGTVVDVAHGGTGGASHTAYAVIFGGLTSTGALQDIGSLGTLGQVLTSSGVGSLPSWQTPTTGTVTSVSGTLNRITSTGGATPVIDIDAAYVGQASITTLGTITTGVWNGTAVDVAHGGTGNTTFTAYSLLCAGTTATGAFQNVSGVGTTGQILTSNGAGLLPTWQSAGSGVTSVSGTTNRITSTGGATPVIDIDAAYVGQASITTLGTVTTGAWNATVVAGQYGGTGVANTGKTITIGGNLTTAGAFNSTFTMTAATAVTFPTTGTLATTTDLITVDHGGTGNTTFTAFSVICAGTTATGAFQNVSGLGTAGQILTSNGAGALPTWQAAPAGTVTSVSGTTNRITSTGGATPVIDIAATYVGQASITTLGAVTTGVWNGTVVTGTFGGTGVNNGANTITLGGNITTAGAFITSGANSLTLTTTGATNITLPTTGTLVTTATAAVLNATNDFNFNILQEAQMKNYSETVSAQGNTGSAVTFDLTNGNVFSATVNAITTVTLSNPAASGQSSSISIILTNGGAFAITWPASVKWPGGIQPTWTASGVDVLTLFTVDAGTTWYGIQAGAAFA